MWLENCVQKKQQAAKIKKKNSFYWGIRNNDEERLLKFVNSFDTVVGNTVFNKDSEKLITFKSSGNSSMIDFVVVKNDVR